MGTTAPDVTVIIPAYNRLWALPDAVNSCRRSSCATEIIVVDDGSSDGTWEWLQSQSDVRALRQENEGKDWAVNRAFAKASGEFIRFLDSDDLLVPNANDLQLEAGRHSSADVVGAGYIFLDETTGTRRTIAWTPCDDFISQQLGECDSSHYSAYLFRREFISEIPHRQEFALRDDRMFAIEVALRQPRVASIDTPTLIHRHHLRERLQFRRGLEMAVTNHSHWALYKRAVKSLEARGELTLRRRRAISKSLWPLAHWVSHTDLGDACRLYDWILELDPDFVPPNAGLLGTFYRKLGFRNTEMLLHVRRFFLSPFTAVRTARL